MADKDQNSEPPITTYAFNWTVDRSNTKNTKLVPKKNYEDASVEQAKSAIEVRKTLEIAEDNNIVAVEGESMRIYSPHLLRIIPEVVGYYPSYSIRGHKDPSRGPVPYLEIAKPYRMISGVRDRLTPIKNSLKVKLDEPNTVEATEATEARVTLSHIYALEHELDKLARPIEEEKRLHQLTPPMATFDMLWLLFRPGTSIITKVSGEWAQVKVYLPTWGGEEKNSKSYLDLITWYHDFDGTHLKRRRHDIRILRFDERHEIKHLSAFPIAYADKSLLESLLARGKAYYGLLREMAPQRDYNGMMITLADEASQLQRGRHTIQQFLGRTAESVMGSAKKQYRGVTILDPFLFATEFGAPTITWLDDTDVRTGLEDESDLRKTLKIDPRSTESLPSDDNYRMLPQWIRGFAVNTRLWATFDVSHMKPYEPKRQMINYLVMKTDKLKMIKAITKPRLEREKIKDAPVWHTFNVEQVNGKGEGRVILLHGPPGTGKTFTAECIAEWTDPTHIESKLWQWFRMAEAWQAVLLIDEADVYVAKRLPNSPGTSLELFLRALEYYKGILFLTTNAILGVDPAITTRATLIVHLDLPDSRERCEICKNMESRVNLILEYEIRPGAQEEIQGLIDDESHSWAFLGLTAGFQVYQVAIALAQNDEEERHIKHNQVPREKLAISASNIRDAKSVVLDFVKYQFEARYETEREVARGDGRLMKRWLRQKETLIKDIKTDNKDLLGAREVEIVSIADQPDRSGVAALIRISPPLEAPGQIRLQGKLRKLDDGFSGITTIVKPKGIHDLDILAIPGLNGNAYGSFKAHGSDDMWLLDGLATRLPNARISLYGYISDYFDRDDHLDLSDMGNKLQRAIRHDFGDNEALVQAYSADSRSVASNPIRGIVSFGVPSYGMNIEAFLQVVGTNGTTTTFLRNLEEGSGVLMALNNRFNNMCRKRRFKGFFFYEGRNTPTVKQHLDESYRLDGDPVWLVRPESANTAAELGIVNDYLKLDKNHRDLVKYLHDDPELITVLTEIERIANQVIAESSSKKGNRPPETRCKPDSDDGDMEHDEQNSNVITSKPKRIEPGRSPALLTASQRPRDELKRPITSHFPSTSAIQAIQIPPLVSIRMNDWLKPCFMNSRGIGATNNARFLYGKSNLDKRTVLALATHIVSQLAGADLPVVLFKCGPEITSAQVIQSIWNQCMQRTEPSSPPKNVNELLAAFESVCRPRMSQEGKCLNIIFYISHYSRDEHGKVIEVLGDVVKRLRDLGQARVLILAERPQPALAREFADDESAAVFSCGRRAITLESLSSDRFGRERAHYGPSAVMNDFTSSLFGDLLDVYWDSDDDWAAAEVGRASDLSQLALAFKRVTRGPPTPYLDPIKHPPYFPPWPGDGGNLITTMDGTQTRWPSNPPSTEDWNSHREIIIDHFLGRNWSLTRLAACMAKDYGFIATSHFTQWNIRKNMSADLVVATLLEFNLSRSILTSWTQLPNGENVARYVSRLPDAKRNEIFRDVVARLPPTAILTGVAHLLSVAPPRDLRLPEECLHVLRNLVQGSWDGRLWGRDTIMGFVLEDTVPAWCSPVMTANWVLTEQKEAEAQDLLQSFVAASPRQLGRNDPLTFPFIYTSVLTFARDRPDIAGFLMKALYEKVQGVLEAATTSPLRRLLFLMNGLGVEGILTSATTILFAYVNMIQEVLGGAYPIVQDLLADFMSRLLKLNLTSPESLADLVSQTMMAAEQHGHHRTHYYFEMRLGLASSYLCMHRYDLARQIAEDVAGDHHVGVRNDKILVSVHILLARINDADNKPEAALECACRAVVHSIEIFGKSSDWTANTLIVYHQMLEKTGEIYLGQAVLLGNDRDQVIRELCPAFTLAVSLQWLGSIQMGGDR
ncbi:putative p-loop containing nucleoside triphosphate hydrolase [Seiridium unicorne]|uniref:P-loop containing nucleoside triphosphate hydrolase n=1 Tax=Seiridium unicorne TaxID=138068 RepID=A0ABR2UJK3_9PEZI